jgi:hypothetical protein
MSTFLPIFLLVVLLSAALSLIVVLIFARVEGAPPAINIRQKCRVFLALPFGEKVRLAKHVPYAILMGAFVCIALMMLFPAVFGHPVIVATVFAITTAMTTVTLSTA